MNKKGKTDMLTILAVLLVLGVVGGFISIQGFSVSGGDEGGTAVNEFTCKDTNLADFKIRVRNPLASSTNYTATNVYYAYASTDKVQGNDTGSASTSGTYETTSDALICGQSYDFVTVNDATTTSCIEQDRKTDEPIETVDMACPKSGLVVFQILDASYTNLTNGTSQFCADCSTDETGGNTTLGAGGTATRILRYKQNETDSQFGSNTLPTYVCADFSLAKFSKASGVTVAGVSWQETDLPKYCAENGYEKAWIIPPVKTSDGEMDARVTIRADVGDPTATDDIKFLFVDSHYFVSSDGTIKSSTSDDSGTAVGETDTYVTIGMQ